MTGRAPRSHKGIRELAAEFPNKPVGPNATLYRAHHEANGAVFYCTNGLCRFDPPLRAKLDFGTCYTAYRDVIALLEHLGDQQTYSWQWMDRRRITQIVPRKDYKVANLRDSTNAGRWGITSVLQTGTNRSQTKSWAAAFKKAGFEGVEHTSAKNAALDEECVAFFGPPGPKGDDENHPLKDAEPQPVSTRTRREFEEMFGFRSFPHALLP